jgi:hypothetical protein
MVKYGVRSPKFIWAPVYSCTHWLRPRNSPPPPAFGLTYEGAIGQPRETTSLCNPLPASLDAEFSVNVLLEKVKRYSVAYLFRIHLIYPLINAFRQLTAHTVPYWLRTR